MIAIKGAGSTIAKALVGLVGQEVAVLHVARDARMPLEADRYLFCSGLLIGKRATDMSGAEVQATFEANYAGVAAECDRIFAENELARICVMGSESGFTGSYDETYAESKALLHRYVEGKRLKPDQQLVCVAPSIVADAGMTLRRTDSDVLAERERKHPKQRFLKALEVARVIRFVLYEDLGYLTNVVIRMNGGEHAWR